MNDNNNSDKVFIGTTGVINLGGSIYILIPPALRQSGAITSKSNVDWYQSPDGTITIRYKNQNQM